MLSKATAIHEFHAPTYPFRDALRGMLFIGNPEDVREQTDGVLTREKDQSLALQREFYERWDGSELQEIYKDFIDVVVEDMAEEPVYSQRVPSFRVHLPNNVGVGSWHRDGDFGHGPAEFNFWLPFTAAYGTNTVWVADESPLSVERAMLSVRATTRSSSTRQICGTGSS